MSKFLPYKDDNNTDANAIAIPLVFYESSRVKSKETKQFASSHNIDNRKVSMFASNFLPFFIKQCNSSGLV